MHSALIAMLTAINLQPYWKCLYAHFWQVILTSKVGQTDLVFGVRWGFIRRSVCARLQVSVCSGCDLPAWLTSRHTNTHR